MCRSRRYAIIVDGYGSLATKHGKVRHNKAIRRIDPLEDIPDGGHYRKLNCIWDYRDYAFDYRFVGSQDPSTLASMVRNPKYYKRNGIWYMPK